MKEKRVLIGILTSSSGRVGLLLVAISVLLGGVNCTMFSMPGTSFEGPAPALDSQQTKLRDRLHQHVLTLAGDIGDRNIFNPEHLRRARVYILDQWQKMGYAPTERTFAVDNHTVANLEVEIEGGTHPDEIVLIGAHYDTAMNPGADDNASGVAGLLELSRMFANQTTGRTLRFVAFVNEEPPFYREEEKMGSRVYARRARQRNEQIVSMLSLEMIGYFSDREESQDYPFPLSLIYPSRGNFIGFVSNFSNRHLVSRCIRTFRQNATIPSEGGAPPGWMSGVGWSDHWSFWQEDYPALMVTDTALFRNPNYHSSSDRPETLDYGSMTRVIEGLQPVVSELADVKSE
jgi:hypothetical protein